MKKSKKGKLYIVPTPIGNLGDMTWRAIDTLKSVKLIGAEDTRTSGKLLKHFQIETPTFSYHKFNERARVEKVLELLESGEDVALISDAGTPGISDPASILIKEAINAGFCVETLPGATAFLPALISSGLDCERFYFIGFLPVSKKEKNLLLEQIKALESTLVFYEAPHRLLKTLELLLRELGDRKVVVARELSKLYETYHRSTLQEITANFDQIILKGEFVIVLEGACHQEIADEQISEMLRLLLKKGESKKNAVKDISEKTGISRNKIYELVLRL